MILETPSINNEIVTAREMRIGQIGTFYHGSDPTIVLRTYDSIVNLKDPSQTWLLSSSHRIRLFPPGSKFILTTEV